MPLHSQNIKDLTAATTGDAIGGGIDPGFYPVTRQYLLDLIFHFKIEHDETIK